MRTRRNLRPGPGAPSLAPMVLVLLWASAAAAQSTPEQRPTVVDVVVNAPPGPATATSTARAEMPG